MYWERHYALGGRRLKLFRRAVHCDPVFHRALGTTSVQSNAGFPMRSINRIRADGAIHHVRYSDVSTQNIRGAASVDGANYYIQAGGGIRFVLGDPTLDLSPSGTVFTHNNATNFQSIHIQTLTTFRGVAIAANTPGGPQLFTAWSAAPGNCGLFSVGAGLPTAVGTTSALQLNCTLFNMGAFNSFHFQDVSSACVQLQE